MKYIVIIALLFSTQQSFGQIGGLTTYSFLNLAYSARSLGLGNDFITSKDKDVNLGISNPSLYNKSMHKHLGFNQGLLPQGIMYGMLSYARNSEKWGTVVGNLRYVDYGRMDRTDISGNVIGKLNASEYTIGAGFGKEISKVLSIGANLNLIYSQMDNFNSFGAAMDLAGTMQFEKSNLLFTTLVKNFGYQFKDYTGGKKTMLPAELQMAVAHKLKHAPFRFSILAHHLNNWNITYVDPTLQPTVDALTGDTIPVKTAGFGEKLAHHFTYQTEILISKSIHLRAAFDYHKRQEMKLESKPAIAGFSFGIGLYFKKITIDYGFAVASQMGYTNMLSLSTNLGQWRK